MTVQHPSATRPRQPRPQAPRPARRRLDLAPWRRALWALLLLPYSVAALALTLAGRPGAAARLQRGLAARCAGRAAGRPGDDRTPLPGLLAYSGLGALFGTFSWVLALIAGPDTVRCVFLYGLTDGRDPATAWGGPTLAGAWAVHAALALALFPVSAWCLRGLAVLQIRLADGLLGRTRMAGWVLPAALAVAVAGALFLVALVHQW